MVWRPSCHHETPTAEAPLENGTELNQYRILSKLGEGWTSIEEVVRSTAGD